MTPPGHWITPALAVLATAMLAGVVHVASLLMMPAFAPNDAYARIARIAPVEAATVLPRAGGMDDPVPGRDPSAATAVCRYDLDRGPLRVAAALGDALYAALALHDRTGVAYYGLNDRAGNGGRLDLVVMTRTQLEAVTAGDMPGTPIRDVRVLAPSPLGFVTLDVLPRIGGYPAATTALRSMRCGLERQP